MHLNLIPRICVSIDSAEDEEAGEIPVAFVVRKSGSSLSCTQVMEYVAKQVKKILNHTLHLGVSSSTCHAVTV